MAGSLDWGFDRGGECREGGVDEFVVGLCLDLGAVRSLLGGTGCVGASCTSLSDCNGGV